jgi:hypothetical protein
LDEIFFDVNFVRNIFLTACLVCRKDNIPRIIRSAKRQVKIDAVERALEEMERGAVDEVEDEVEVAKRLAAAVRLKKLNAD